MLTNRRSFLGITFAAVLAAGFLYLNARIDRVAAAGKPVATPVLNASAGLFVNIRPAASPGPASGNATAIIVFGQMLDFDDNKAPHILSSVPMSIAADPFERFNLSLPFNAVCSTFTGNTMYQCTLTPTGANWGTSGTGTTVAARFSATANNGDVAIGTVVFGILP